MKTKLVALFILALVACSKSDPKPVFDIAGSWSISSPTITGQLKFTRSGNALVLTPHDTSNQVTLFANNKYSSGVELIGNSSYYVSNSYPGNYGSTDNISIHVGGYSYNNKYGHLVYLNIDSGKVSTDFRTIIFLSKYYIKVDGCPCDGIVVENGAIGYTKYIKETVTMTRN